MDAAPAHDHPLRGSPAGLKAALDALRVAGCRRAYVNGSFVTAKEEPGDVDACWEPAGVDLDVLDPVLLTFDEGRRAQKAKYGGELFQANLPADLARTTFLAFFQRSRDGVSPRASSRLT